jgi:hypothetical protein
MLVRIVRQPNGVVDGMALHYYHVGQIYEIDTSLANYLIVEGFARAEMRRGPRSFRVRASDRRSATVDN